MPKNEDREIMRRNLRRELSKMWRQVLKPTDKKTVH